MIFDFDSAVIEVDTPTQEDIEEHFNNIKTAKGWAIVARDRYGLDYKTEYNRKIEANRKRNIENCGLTGKWAWNPETFRKEWRPTYCKSMECPRCRANKEIKNTIRLENLFGNKFVDVDPADELEFKSGLGKDDYLRVHMGSFIRFVLDELAEDGEECINIHNIKDMAKKMIPGEDGTRVSGNLGKSVPAIKEEEPVVDFDNPEFEIKGRVFDIDFSTGGLTPEKLEEAVLKRLKLTSLDKTSDNLQFIIYQLEELTKAVCEEYGIKILFLYIVDKIVKSNKIRWDNLLFKPKVV